MFVKVVSDISSETTLEDCNDEILGYDEVPAPIPTRNFVGTLNAKKYKSTENHAEG